MSSTPGAGHPARQSGLLVTGGMSHDFDRVRREILERLAPHEHLRITVAPDFEHVVAAEWDFLISYTCNVRVSAAAEAALGCFVAEGGRWLALHATNSWLEWTPDGVASAHADRPFFRLLGSAFVAHPPIGPFRVEPVSDHPLVRGIPAFEVEDELYLSDFLGDVEVLLATEFDGRAPGFTRDDWSGSGPHPVMYLRRTQRGEVLYLTLGHARGHYDAPHRTPWYPHPEYGAWHCAEFQELLDRSLAWVTRRSPLPTTGVDS